MKNVASIVFISLWVGFLTGCGDMLQINARTPGADADDEPAQSVVDQGYVKSAQPFIDAIIRHDYVHAFSLLSPHARTRMSRNQFFPPVDDAQFKRLEATALTNVRLEEFVSLMKKVETELGYPVGIEDIEVFSTDPVVLSGKDKFEAIFAIGAMPESVPHEIRRASLRCRIEVQLPRARLQAIAYEYGITVEQIEQNPGYTPYLTLKLVLVEEGDQMQAGYFEFMPPSLFD